MLRVAAVVVGAVRTLRQHRRFVVFRAGRIEAATALEPPLLAVVAVLLLSGSHPGSPGTIEIVAAVGGALLVLYGLNLLAWSLRSWRALFVGHGVIEGQRLITSGAYGLVRHPVYLGALLIWAGLSLAFLSVIAAALTALFVAPVYLLYIRSEEAMMAERFGEEYERYRHSVPALVPRLGRRP